MFWRGAFKLMAPFTAMGILRNCARQTFERLPSREASGFVNSIECKFNVAFKPTDGKIYKTKVSLVSTINKCELTPAKLLFDDCHQYYCYSNGVTQKWVLFDNVFALPTWCDRNGDISYYRPHPKDDGRLYFQSVHTCNGEGVPHLRSGWGGTPSQV